MRSIKLVSSRLAAFAVAAACLSIAASSVAVSAQEGTLRVSTQLVMVDVVVTDEDGPVRNLAIDDFAVFDTGTRQDLAVFEVVSTQTEDVVALPAGIVSNRRDWQGAVPTSATVILVDRLNTPTADQIFMNRLLLEFMQSFDQAGRLALYELGNEFRIVHDFTRNPQELLRLVGELEPEQSLALESSDSNGGFETGLNSAGVDRALVEFRDRNAGLVAFEGRFSRLTGDYFLENRAQRTLTALEVIAHHLEGLPGRKNLVWLSGRFPFTFYPRRQTDLTQEVGLTTLLWMERVGHLLTANNIAIYPVDVRGPGTTDDDAYLQGVMRTIAEMTGGRGYYGTNSVGEAIGRAVADTQLTYSLGFYPSQAGENGSFRTLDVEVVDREDASVQHRPGYFAFQDPDSATLPGLAEMLASPLDATSIGLVGRAGAAPDGEEGYRLLVLIDMNDLTLVQTDGRRVGTLDFAAFFESAEDGSVAVLPSETLPVNLTEEGYQNALDTGFLFQKPISTDGQAGRLRVVVRDRATGAAGSMWISAGTE